MFKVLIIACTILPFPRGEILNTKCYSVVDERQPSIYGYKSKKKCEERLNVIKTSIRENFDLLYLKKHNCKKSKEIS
tara:strand:+ start:393 stop:623 length:231 start_codon:yes stop_codon:yes gene_type:complete